MASVEYYEKMKSLQEKHHESERHRHLLEQEMNSAAKSDARLAQLRTTQLQAYWKRICEEEKRSQQRNEQILSTIDRIDSYTAMLEEKTEKLRQMKVQYEEYVEQTYPNWKQKIIEAQRVQTLAQSNQQQMLFQRQQQPCSFSNGLQQNSGITDLKQPFSANFGPQSQSYAGPYIPQQFIPSQPNYATGGRASQDIHEPTSIPHNIQSIGDPQLVNSSSSAVIAQQIPDSSNLQQQNYAISAQTPILPLHNASTGIRASSNPQQQQQYLDPSYQASQNLQQQELYQAPSIQSMQNLQQQPYQSQSIPLSQSQHQQPNRAPSIQSSQNLQQQQQPYRAPSIQASQSPQQPYQAPSIQSSQSLQQPYQAPSIQSSQNLQQPYQAPSIQSSQSLQQPYQAPSIQSSQSLQQPYQAPIIQSSQSLQQSYQAPIIQSSLSLQQPYQAPIIQSSQSLQQPYQAPSIQSSHSLQQQPNQAPSIQASSDTQQASSDNQNPSDRVSSSRSSLSQPHQPQQTPPASYDPTPVVALESQTLSESSYPHPDGLQQHDSGNVPESDEIDENSGHPDADSGQHEATQKFNVARVMPNVNNSNMISGVSSKQAVVLPTQNSSASVDQAHVSVPSVPRPSEAPQSIPVTDNTDGAVASFFGGSSTGTPIQSESRPKSTRVPKPDVSVDGFCNMLDAIEIAITRQKDTSEFYRSATPSTRVENEIVNEARTGGKFEHVNTASITMYILDQLPFVSFHENNGSSFFNDRILTSFSGNATNNVFRQQLSRPGQELWDRLYEHFVCLLKYEVLPLEEIVENFAPLLIDPDSIHFKKAESMLASILKNIPPDELMYQLSARSTSDFSAASPRKPYGSAVTAQPADKRPKDNFGRSSLPVLNPRDSIDFQRNLKVKEEEDEDYLSRSVVTSSCNFNNLDTLTQTAAYKKILADSSMSYTQKSENQSDSSDSDDIEKDFREIHQRSVDDTARKDLRNDLNKPTQGADVSSRIAGPTTGVAATPPSPSSTANSEQFKSQKKMTSLNSSGKSTIHSIVHKALDDLDDEYEDDDDIPGLGQSNKSDKNEDEDEFWD